MNKSLRIVAISLICTFFIFCTNCFAVNIDMNLSSDLLDNNVSYSYNTDLGNYTQVNGNNSTENSVSAQSNETNSMQNDTLVQATSSDQNAGIPDSLQALPESELGLTNILNILLIAIGFVLILLSIAVFIRLKH